jgi:lipopolysaccharide transport system permease protein
VTAPAGAARLPVTDIRRRPLLGSLGLRELWAYRELLYFLVWRDVKVRYRQTAIGIGWAIVQPFFTMVVFSLFFGRLAGIPSDGLPYPLFFYSAMVPWTYFANALIGVTNTMVDHQGVIKKVYFPRLLLPLASIVSGLLDFVIAFTVLVGIALYYGVLPRAVIVTVPALVLVAATTALGVGLWLSALNARYRDVRYAVPFLVQIWMFASPVAYPASLVPARWQWLYGLNPMAGVIEGVRAALGGSASVALFGPSLIAVVVVLLGGFVYFQRMQGTIADVV